MTNSVPVGGSDAEPPIQPTTSGPSPLPDRGGNHVVAEHVLAAARPAGAHHQHLVPGHAEHVAEAQQHRQPKRDAAPIDGHSQKPTQATRISTLPIRIAWASLPRSIQRPSLTAENTGMMAKPVAMTPSQKHRQAELERPVGRGDPDDQDHRLQEHDMGNERIQQAVVDIALGRF